MSCIFHLFIISVDVALGCETNVILKRIGERLSFKWNKLGGIVWTTHVFFFINFKSILNYLKGMSVELVSLSQRRLHEVFVYMVHTKICNQYYKHN